MTAAAQKVTIQVKEFQIQAYQLPRLAITPL